VELNCQYCVFVVYFSVKTKIQTNGTFCLNKEEVMASCLVVICVALAYVLANRLMLALCTFKGPGAGNYEEDQAFRRAGVFRRGLVDIAVSIIFYAILALFWSHFAKAWGMALSILDQLGSHPVIQGVLGFALFIVSWAYPITVLVLGVRGAFRLCMSWKASNCEIDEIGTTEGRDANL